MKGWPLVLIVVAATFVAALSLAQRGATASAAEVPAVRAPVYEGVVWSVEWEDGRGKTRGLTRAAQEEAVPGGSGSWNMDMRGRLYTTELEVTFPGNRDLGPLYIPWSRIVSIQFGDGGRKQVRGG
jgi:hypothetical protein